LRTAVESCSGHVVDHRGDEFFMVFQDAKQAAQAVSEAQRAFAAHDWPEGVELRVRMGMHTGEPTFREGAYYGIDVHRAARIAQAGSGGQILVSKRTRDELDSTHELEDLGDHELPGLGEPERLYQLNVPGRLSA
jgi:class 3 adenylate cyclase